MGYELDCERIAMGSQSDLISVTLGLLEIY